MAYKLRSFGAVAKWLRQRIANPLSPVRIRAAPFSEVKAPQRLTTSRGGTFLGLPGMFVYLRVQVPYST